MCKLKSERQLSVKKFQDKLNNEFSIGRFEEIYEVIQSVILTCIGHLVSLFKGQG